MSLEIGTKLRYHEIAELLGKGGMGEVYRARDTKLKRDVAIKILPDEFSRDPARVSRFQREAEVLASLNHPNIAAIYDLQQEGEARFLVMELVEGPTLAERIARGPIPVEEALEKPRVAAAVEQSLLRSQSLWKRAIPLLVTALVFTAVGMIANRMLRSPDPPAVIRFPIVLSETREPFNIAAQLRRLVALSPDGTKLAYVANGTNGQLYIRHLSELQARPLPGAVFVVNPFFWPDSQWIGFISLLERALKKIPRKGTIHFNI